MIRDDDDYTIYQLPLDDDTVERLHALSKATKVPPVVLAASLLHDVLRDDEITNAEVESKIKGAAGQLH